MLQFKRDVHSSKPYQPLSHPTTHAQAPPNLDKISGTTKTQKGLKAWVAMETHQDGVWSGLYKHNSKTPKNVWLYVKNVSTKIFSIFYIKL